MTTSFNADEVFEMAEEIERNGAKFYRRAAEGAEGEMRQVFLDLAEMEDDHEDTFVKMRKDLMDPEIAPVIPDMDNEGALYLQAFADGKAFATDPEQAFADNATVADILRTAISLEKDTIVFYQSLKGYLSGKVDAEKVNSLINEEIGHILTLSTRLAAV